MTIAGQSTPDKSKRRIHPAMEAHKWKPGESGNKSGRPKRKPITELYKELLSDPENLEMVRTSIIKSISGGQMAMVLLLREMTDRVEGKVTQPIEADVTVNLADAIAEARSRLNQNLGVQQIV
jgi:hypothetical protein